MNTFMRLILQGGHSTCFSWGFFAFLLFEHVCLKNVIFNKIKGPPVILRKKISGRLILNKDSRKWVFVKGNLFSNNLCFLLSF